MDKTYGVALIGCGHMGEAHISNIYYKTNVRMEYVCDLDQNRAELFQKKYGVRLTCTDPAACIQDENVDIVIIATYPSTHLELLKLCLKNHKHVLCEKPIAGNHTEGKEFLREVKEHTECKVLIGHILRHNATYQKVAEMIQNGAIGKPIAFRMVQNHHTMDWEKYKRMLGEASPLLDCGVHYVDIIKWFTGSEVKKIAASGARTEPDLPEGSFNYGLMMMELEDGSVGYYEAGWSNTLSADNLKEFSGPRGSIRIIYRKDRQTHQEEGDLIEYYKFPEKVYEMINVQCQRKPTGRQFDHLVKMIETGCNAVPDIDEVYESFVVCLRAQEQVSKEYK